ncbi:hypothetical protein [Arthrobacter sp. R4-81]
MSTGPSPLNARLEPPRDVDATRAQALNVLSRAPRMAMLRSLRGETWRPSGQIYEAAGISPQEGLPHLLALQDLGVVREDQGSFSLDVELLNRILEQTSLSAPATGMASTHGEIASA